MSSAPGTGSETASLVAEFCAARYGASGAAEFGIDRETFTGMVAVVVERWNAAPLPSELSQFLGALRVDELVLTRACAAGHDVAWEKFLNRYRATLYSAAYKIAHDVLGYARYHTPIVGLYMCGSGTHPGSGLTGRSGENAAREIIKDLR
jgi:phytoene dehydrogenase-like protein